MDGFGEKLRLVYAKIFDEDMDKFTEALIDYQKFQPERFDLESEDACRKQFFLNRKTVLRRWLHRGSRCTPDFQKSFQHYQLSKYQLKGKALFSLDDFRRNGDMEAFEDKVALFVERKNRVQVKSDYLYLYTFCEIEKKIIHYKIVKWSRGEGGETLIHLEREGEIYEGSFSLSEESNIFITLRVGETTLYFLFHDNNDLSCPYIVGMSMGYLPHDNKVPRSQKVIFAKELLDECLFDLTFILNETEVISAIENRQNLNSKAFKLSHFIKYANRLKRYGAFFQKLVEKRYQEQFYYRLAFREFHTIARLFGRVAQKETYFIYDYQRALCELIETVEAIRDIPLYVVMERSEKSIFVELSQKNLEIKKRFLDLSRHANIKITIIFVEEKGASLPQVLIEELLSHDIEIHLVYREEVIHEVNSLDFIFIDLRDKRDFVLADPLRDSKEVYKIFTNEVIMDEYKTDYQKLLRKSRRVQA